MNVYFASANIPLFVGSAAKRSAEQSIYVLGQNGGFFNGGCGQYKHYKLWQTEEEFCDIDIKENFEKHLQSYLDKYLGEYPGVEIPLDNYEFFIRDADKLTINGIAIKNAIYNDTRIMYSLKPSFEIDVGYNLNYYGILMAELKQMIGSMVRCEKEEGLFVCFGKEKQKANNDLSQYNLRFVDIKECGAPEEESDLDLSKGIGRFCVKGNERFVVYDNNTGETELTEISIKFAAYMVDLPPESLSGIKIYDHKKDNGSVIVAWNRDTASDAKTFSLYLSESPFINRRIENRHIAGVKQINITNIEGAEIINDIDLTGCTGSILERPCLYAKYGKPLFKGKLYLVKDAIQEYYIYAIDELKDNKLYYFAVTGIDANENELNNDRTKPGSRFILADGANYITGKSIDDT
ncbi:hypothetical protein KY360_00495 [Candidatus Woesearchaeota archaeon]|nr:hypothetical protein [Candidatus Woesearchaeota archaeon]